MMTEPQTFAERIRERYPEGLTAMLAIGGTRMTYILDTQSGTQNPGSMGDMRDYARDMNARMRTLIHTYLDLGGQNVIIPLLSYQLFENERGAEYADLTARMALDLLDEEWVGFYRENQIDPYFAGIDTLLRFPERPLSYELGVACERFNQGWAYQEGRHKLIWEVAPIPLYSIWRAPEVMDERAVQLEADLDSASNLQTIHDTLYRYYARAVYGTEMPTPHFYLGTNRNGDLKLRAILPIALLCGGQTRLFFTPYPTMYITRETLQTILEDLAFGKRLRSLQTDYSGQLTPELVATERERVLQLSGDPRSTLGLTRSVDSQSSTHPSQPRT